MSADGLVTALRSGTALLQATNEGTSGLIAIQVALTNTDSDADGIPDDEELRLGLNPSSSTDALEDADRDGLSNLREYQVGTEVRNADTDGDGIGDGAELSATNGFATDPRQLDTDGDGLSDGLEVQTGSNPLDRTSRNLAQALTRIRITPGSFTLVFNTVLGEAFTQLQVTGDLADGRTLPLTARSAGTNYTSNRLDVCSFGGTDGAVFAGTDGTCSITVTNSGHTATVSGTVTTFSPTPMGFVSLPGEAMGVAVSGTFAYVAAGTRGLHVIDVSSPTAPRIVATLDTPGWARAVSVSGQTAWVADGGSGIHLVDISDPLQPRITATVDTPGDAHRVTFSADGQFVYVADGYAGMHLVRWDAGQARHLIQSTWASGGSQVIGVSRGASDALLAVTLRNVGVRLLEQATPGTFNVLSTVAGGDPRAALVAGGTLLIADYERSLTPVDISNPAAPAIRSSVPMDVGGRLQDLALQGRFAFGADVFFVNGVPIIDVADPRNPVPRAILDFRNFRDDDGTGIAADSAYVYLTASLNGDSRLYIGAYVLPTDGAGRAPTVRLTAPVDGTEVIERTRITARADASDDIAVRAVTFYVNGIRAAVVTSRPYEYAFDAPLGSGTLTVRAEADDFGGNVATTPEVLLRVKPGLGHIEGRVTETGNASPVAGTRVQIFGAAGQLVTDATTDADGRFTTTGLAAGSYYVKTATGGSYIDVLYDGRYCINCNVTTGASVPVVDGAVATVNFSLVRPARISGMVVETSSGRALPNINVSVVKAHGEYVAGAATDAAGLYSVGNLAPGTYFVRTHSSQGYINELFGGVSADCVAPGVGTAVVVPGGGQLTGIDFSLELGGKISGVVKRSDTAAGAPGIGITFFSTTGRCIGGAGTDGNGRYTSNGLAPGTYHARTYNSLALYNELYAGYECFNCDVTAGTPIVVTAGTVHGDIDFTVRPGGGSIAGHVRDAATGGAAGFAWVEIFDSTGRQVTSGWLDPGGQNPTAFVTQDGLPPGTYYARARSNDGYAAQIYRDISCPGCQVTQGTPIIVTANTTTTEINFSLSKGSRISGRVTDVATGAGLSGVNVQVYDVDGRWVAAVDTDEAGAYALQEGLAAGEYLVRTWNAGLYLNRVYGSAAWCTSCDIRLGSRITVGTGGTVAGIDLPLTRGGRISGRLMDAATGGAAATASIQLRDGAGRWVTAASVNSRGEFTTEAMLPGTYYARTVNSAGYFNQLYSGKPCDACEVTALTGTGIIVAAGETTSGIDISLTPGGGWIAGRVTDGATGAPLAGVTVEIYNAAGVRVSSGYTNSWAVDAGAYIIEGGLSPGTYFAKTWNSAGYLSEQYRERLCLGCSVTDGTPIVITGPGAVTGVNFSLQRGGRLGGRVTDAQTGDPLPNVWVHVEDSGGRYITGGTSDSEGRYITNEGLVAGNYYARTYNSLGYTNGRYSGQSCTDCPATGGTAIAVVEGMTTTGIDFALRRGASVSGRVFAAATGSGLAGVSLQLFDLTGRFVTSVNSAADGVYTLTGVPSGSYRLRTWNAGIYLNQVYGGGPCANCDIRTGSVISVTETASTANIDLGLTLGGRLTGRVIDSGTGAGVPPSARVSVEIKDAENRYITAASVDAQGRFTTEAVLPGTYYSRTTNGGGYTNQLFDGIPCFGCAVQGGTPVSLEAGVTREINFTLTGGGGWISGRVVDALTGVGIGASVEVFNAAGEKVANGYANSAGEYVIQDGLAPGTYYAKANHNDGYISQLYAAMPCVACSPTAGTAIQVVGGTVTPRIDFALVPGARISGRVTDAVTGSGIGGVWVHVEDGSGRYMTGGTTDFQGNYLTQGGLPEGMYYLRTFTTDDHVNAAYPAITCVGCSARLGSGVQVSSGGVIAGVDFALSRGGFVSGSITSATTGAPLGGVDVEVNDGRYASYVRSNSDGTYRTREPLPAGVYFVRAYNAGNYLNALFGTGACNSCNIFNSSPVTVPAGGIIAGIDMALVLGGRISGTLTSDTGAPVASAWVNVYNTSGAYVTGSGTDAAGRYTTEGLPAATYYVRTFNTAGFFNQLYKGLECLGCSVTIGTPVAVQAGQRQENIDMTLRSGGGVLTGRVTDAVTGQPVRNVSVNVYDATGRFVGSGFTGSSATGTWTIDTGLPTGTYFARTFVNQPGYVNQLFAGSPCTVCTVTTGTPIAVTGGMATTNVNFALEPGGQIAGRVTDAATGGGVGNVAVNVTDSLGRLILTARSDASGNYFTASAGLPAGSYFLKTSGNAVYIDQLYAGTSCINCPVIAGTPVVVAPGATTTNIDFPLRAGGRIQGVVTNTVTGAAVPNALVSVFSGASQVLASAFTDASGRYQSTTLPTGKYFVRVSSATGMVLQLYQDITCINCTTIAGTPVAVDEPKVTDAINFALVPQGRITGLITDRATGLPLAAAQVDVYTSQNRFVVAGLTNSAGRFTVNVAAGTYYVRAASRTGYAPAFFGAEPCAGCTAPHGLPIDVLANAETGQVDFRLDARPRLTGRVIDAITLTPAQTLVQVIDSEYRHVATAATALDGTYSTVGLPAGIYYVRTLSFSGYLNQVAGGGLCVPGCNGSEGNPVLVADTGVVVDFALQRGARISGRVTRSDTGAPVSGVPVMVFDSRGMLAASGGSDIFGNYLTGDGLPPGVYFVRTSTTQLFVSRLYGGGNCLECAVTAGTPVVVDSPSTIAGINIGVELGGRIAGRLLQGANSQPIVNVTVIVTDAAGATVSNTVTDSAGLYQSVVLPAGNYFVKTINTIGLVDEAFHNVRCDACDPRAGNAVSVQSGAVSSGVSFVLDAPQEASAFAVSGQRAIAGLFPAEPGRVWKSSVLFTPGPVRKRHQIAFGAKAVEFRR